MFLGISGQKVETGNFQVFGEDLLNVAPVIASKMRNPLVADGKADRAKRGIPIEAP